MFYYNVTCSIEQPIEPEWLEWMRNEHIPEVMQTQCFTECKMLKLISPENEEGNIVYAIQYVYQQQADFDRYMANFADILRQKTTDIFGEKVIAFRTHLHILETFTP